jgi:hypothetical protein
MIPSCAQADPHSNSNHREIEALPTARRFPGSNSRINGEIEGGGGRGERERALLAVHVFLHSSPFLTKHVYILYPTIIMKLVSVQKLLPLHFKVCH